MRCVPILDIILVSHVQKALFLGLAELPKSLRLHASVL